MTLDKRTLSEREHRIMSVADDYEGLYVAVWQLAEEKPDDGAADARLTATDLIRNLVKTGWLALFYWDTSTNTAAPLPQSSCDLLDDPLSWLPTPYPGHGVAFAATREGADAFGLRSPHW
jgi:hypothetical protein